MEAIPGIPDDLVISCIFPRMCFDIFSCKFLSLVSKSWHQYFSKPRLIVVRVASHGTGHQAAIHFGDGVWSVVSFPDPPETIALYTEDHHFLCYQGLVLFFNKLRNEIWLLNLWTREWVEVETPVLDDDLIYAGMTRDSLMALCWSSEQCLMEVWRYLGRGSWALSFKSPLYKPRRCYAGTAQDTGMIVCKVGEGVTLHEGSEMVKVHGDVGFLLRRRNPVYGGPSEYLYSLNFADDQTAVVRFKVGKTNRLNASVCTVIKGTVVSMVGSRTGFYALSVPASSDEVWDDHFIAPSKFLSRAERIWVVNNSKDLSASVEFRLWEFTGNMSKEISSPKFSENHATVGYTIGYI